MLSKACGKLVLIIFSSLWLCGCAHYHTGGSKLPFETLCVAPVRNDSFAPQMQAVLSAQIRQRLSQHPELRLANDQDADATLTVTIVHFGQSVATTMSNDTVRAKSFTVNAKVNCSLFDNRSGNYLFKDLTVGASVDSRAEGDYHRNKSQAIPQLSQKLAEKIGDIVCNPW